MQRAREWMQIKALRWDQHVAFDGGSEGKEEEEQQQQQQQQHVWAGVHVRSGDKVIEAETFAVRECVARCDIAAIRSACPNFFALATAIVLTTQSLGIDVRKLEVL